MTVCVLGAVQAAHAQTIPTIGCGSDPNIFNTGYDATTGGVKASGATDTYWRAHRNGAFLGSGIIHPPPANPNYAPAYVGRATTQWSASPYPKAQWILSPYAGQSGGNDDWWYRYQFNLDPSVNPANFSLQMDFMADNAVSEVWINGVAQSTKTTGLPQNGAGNPANSGTWTNPYNYQGFIAWRRSVTTLNHDWQPGLNTIVVLMKSGIPWQGFLASYRPNTPLCITPPLVEVSKTTTVTAAAPGAQVPYTITVANVGTVAAGGTAVSDPLPAGVASIEWTCTGAGGAVCPSASGSAAINETLATLPAGGAVTYEVLASLATGAPMEVTNVASITPPAGGACQRDGVADPTCSASVTLPPVPQLSITKTASTTTLTPGGEITYTITVANTGSVAASGVAVSDDMADGITAMNWTCNGPCPKASGTGALNETIASLAPGAMLTYTITASVAANPPSVVVNTASVNPGSGGVCTPGNTAAPCTATASVPPVPLVSITKTANVSQVRAGSSLVYTVTVANIGSVAANGTTLIDALPTGVESMAWTCASGNGTAICPNASGSGAVSETIADLPAGSSLIYTLTATVNANPPLEIVNSATVEPAADGVCVPSCVAEVRVTRQTTTGDAVTPVPTLAQWSLVLLALMLGVGAMCGLRQD